MFPRKVRLDRKNKVVAIKDRLFEAKDVYFAGKRYFRLDLNGGNIELLQDVRFDHLPDDLIIFSVQSPKITFNDDPLLNFKIGKGRVSCRILFTHSKIEWKPFLAQSEYFDRLNQELREHGYFAEIRASNDDVYLLLKEEVYPEQTVYQVVCRILSIVERVNSWANERDREILTELNNIVNRLSSFDGWRLTSTFNLHGIARWIVGALAGNQIAYLVLNSGLLKISQENVQRVLQQILVCPQEAIEALRYLGLIRRTESQVFLSKIGLEISRALLDMSSRRIKPAPFNRVNSLADRHFAVGCLNHVLKNFHSYMILISPRMKRSQRSKMKFREIIERELKTKITFIHLAVIMGMRLNQLPALDLIENEIDELIRMGLISENLRFKPQGIAIAHLIESYCAKVRMITPSKALSDLAKVWDWKSVSSVVYNVEDLAREYRRRKGEWWLT